MKIDELMIGDLVYSSFSDIPCKVQYLELRESGYGSVKTSNVDGIKDIASLYPIPLTPEILENNGFVSKKGRFMQLGNFDNPPLILWHLVDDPILRHPKNQLEIHHGAESIHVSFMCHYVHQLQHALRLCGIDKELII